MEPIKKIVIVGGGTSGWMSATLLAKLTGNAYEIVLVESSEISTIGVGEATIPPIQEFNNLIGLKEKEFIQATKGTFKLGIEFSHWGGLDQKYMHGFGRTGRSIGWVSFYQYWLKLKSLGKAKPLDRYRICNQMAVNHKFAPAQKKMPNSPLSDIAHAYHIDAGLYGQHLRKMGENLGVKRIDGKIVAVNQEATSGFIESLQLESGQLITGDFFIDCSGMRGLLIEETLKTGFEDWSHWLPCNSAIAVSSERSEPLLPYTRSIAHDAGWQWRIPLQHRTGNGHVYSSDFISHDKAEAILLKNIDNKLISDPKLIKFKTGKRKLAWNKNCVAIGLSSGFLEPLESTSIHFVQSAIKRLVKSFPDKHFKQANIDDYNQKSSDEMDSVRDFIIAHYKVTKRDDSEFWRYCKSMEIPDSLANRFELFNAYGRVNYQTEDIFREEAWVQVLLGQGMYPQGYDPIVDLDSIEEIKQFIDEIEKTNQECLSYLPGHADFIRQQFTSTVGFKTAY